METNNNEELKNQDDVNPGSALEKMILNEEDESAPKTDGTGSNRPVYNDESLIVEDEESEADMKGDEGMGTDLDGTNPGVRKPE